MLKVSKVTRQHVAAIFTPLMRDGKDPTAQMVWEAVSNVLTWAVTFGHRDDNPLIRLKPDFKKVARDRVLSMEEVAASMQLRGAAFPQTLSTERRGPRETRRSPKAPLAGRGTHDCLDPNNRRGSRGTIPALTQLERESACVFRVVYTFAS